MNLKMRVLTAVRKMAQKGYLLEIESSQSGS